ncbi:MAG TPA: SBBP repeat-containing protein [Chloroflexia bacterium]|nr:SBBP repeat-containing protein [Chloroflexia bacterium]
MSLLRPITVTPASTLPTLDRLPLSFEPNVGQTDPFVRFIAHVPGGLLYFTSGEVVLSLTQAPSMNERRERADGGPITPQTAAGVTARLQFVGANPSPGIQSGNALGGKVSYFLGSDPAQWHTGLETFSGVTYSGLYSGVDLSYTGTNGTLKGTYKVAPNADPSQIRWRYAGVSGLGVDGAGNLQITLNSTAGAKVATLTEQAPIAWQEVAGEQVPVQARYAIADGVIGFTLGSYNPAYPLTIDPTLTYSSYFGGTSGEAIEGIAVDGAGNIYVSGTTFSADFPIANGYQGALQGGYDVFISKLNPAGSALIYSTFIGGSDSENGGVLAVDPTGNAYVTGETESEDYPTVNAFQPEKGYYYEAFVSKLAPSGDSLVYSTYLGGSFGMNGSDAGLGIATDAEGNAYVAGETASTDFPILNAFQGTHGGSYDAFATKFGPSGALVYSTFLGGSGFDQGMDIAVDSAGSVYVTGRADSDDFPTLNALQPANAGQTDVFVTKLNPSGGSLAYSTYLGGSDNDLYYDGSIAVDPEGNAYVTGQTDSADFPLANAYQPLLLGENDIFLSKLNPAGSAFVYSTYFGGTGFDSGYTVAADGAGNAYLSGNTHSTDLPVVNPVQSAHGGGLQDAYIAQFPPNGESPLFSTYLGGANNDSGNDVTVGSDGAIYVGGMTSSLNFPVTANAYQATRQGSMDGFIVRIDNPIVPTPTGTPPTATPRPPTRTNTPTITPTPYPCLLGWNQLPSPENRKFEDVTVLSADDVWVVGFVADSANTIPSTAHWDGTQWSEVSVPSPEALSNELYGIDAVSADDIWAVGVSRSSGTISSAEPLIFHWDGSAWTRVAAPPVQFGELRSVSALASNDVWAVGTQYYEPAYTDQGTFTIHWDGTAWSAVPSPNVETSGNDNLLRGVHAIAPDDVWAVGSVGANSYDHTFNTLTLHWNGTAWSIVPSPNPSSYQADILQDVTATSANDVWAAGYYVTMVPNGGYYYEISRPLLLRWNGIEWTETVGALRGEGDHDIYGIHAISPNDVWAVGSSQETTYGGNPQTLTEHWNGLIWTVVDSPSPSGFYNYLKDVDAAAPDDVWAVGAFTDLGTDSLVLRYSNPCPTPVPTSIPTSIPSITVVVPTVEASSTPVLPTITVAVPTATLVEDTPTATPEGTPQACPIQFSDVPEGSTFYTYIRCLACRQVLGGYADGTFRPGADITRGQLAKVVAVAAGYNDPTTEQTFEDVPVGSTFHSYIENMATRGIVGGYPCGSEGEPCGTSNKPYFRPGANANRGQISKIIATAAQINGIFMPQGRPEEEQMFEDVPPTNTFYNWVQMLASHGMVAGYTCGGEGEPCGPTNMPYFRTYNNATRGQAAKIIANTFFPNCNP